MFENRYDPIKWNIYLFYFTDGENWDNDNEVFCKTLEGEFGPEAVNMVGITQVLPWNYEGSLKQYVDKNCTGNNIKTTQIGTVGSSPVNDQERDKAIRIGIADLLGRGKSRDGNHWPAPSG